MAAKKKDSLIDVAAELIERSGITLEDVVEFASKAISDSSKKSRKSSKKESKEGLLSLITELIGFPQISEKTYWAIRDSFQKNVPDDVTVAALTDVTGLKDDEVSNYVVPALGLLGLLKDGKPTSKLKSWLKDSKYVETCLDIAEEVYPETLRKLGCKTEEEQKDALNWFVKNAKVSKSTAKKMLGVYMLLSNPKLKKDADEKATAASKGLELKMKKSSEPEASH